MKNNKSLKTEYLKLCDNDTSNLAHFVATHGVVQIKPPPVGPAELVQFLSKLGPLMFTLGEIPVPEHPDLNIVTNVNRTTKPKSVFHSDTTYVLHPPSFSSLIAIEVPESGGATLFTDQYAALDNLDNKLHKLLVGARVLHGPTDVPETEAIWHPLIRKNPHSGRNALFLTSISRCRRLLLSDGTDRTDLLSYLYNHSVTCNPPRKHVWKTGDVIIWDNRCTLHAADHSNVVGTRTLFRGLVCGEKPKEGLWNR